MLNNNRLAKTSLLYERNIVLDKDYEIRDVKKITIEEKEKILSFLQGAVYCWCKNRKDEWFALRNLMGGANFYWEGTPLMALYEKYKYKENATELAGKDAGWLLKKIIHDDKRKFTTKVEAQTRQYKWIDSVEI